MSNKLVVQSLAETFQVPKLEVLTICNVIMKGRCKGMFAKIRLYTLLAI
jgi:hypothetical protein